MITQQPDPYREFADDASKPRLVYLIDEQRSGARESLLFGELVLAFYRDRWIVIAILALCLAMSIAAYTIAKPWYRVEVKLLPVEAKTSNGLIGQVSQITGVLGLAGLTGGGPRPEPLAVLRSADFAAEFIRDSKVDELLNAQIRNGALVRVGLIKVDDLNLQDATEYFQTHVSAITEDRRGGLITLSMKWRDPQVAADWANSMADRINVIMRRRAIQEAEGNIQYLRGELDTAAQVSVQQALGRLLESELERLLVARGNTEFAFRVIDRAHPPKRPVSPVLAAYALAAVFFAVVISMGTVLWRMWARSQRAGSKEPT